MPIPKPNPNEEKKDFIVNGRSILMFPQFAPLQLKLKPRATRPDQMHRVSVQLQPASAAGAAQAAKRMRPAASMNRKALNEKNGLGNFSSFASGLGSSSKSCCCLTGCCLCCCCCCCCCCFWSNSFAFTSLRNQTPFSGEKRTFVSDFSSQLSDGGYFGAIRS